ncbi:MAG: response regulator [Pseudomonadota bacterium]|nr:response regulator [Pseudomonadota bacterium]
MKPIRILLVEDSSTDAELIGFELEDAGIDCELVRVELRQELEAALKQHDWTLAICDSRLPGFGGEDAFALIRQALPQLPVLFCTGGETDPEGALAAAISQAHGHISKDRLNELVPAILKLGRA